MTIIETAKEGTKLQEEHMDWPKDQGFGSLLVPLDDGVQWVGPNGQALSLAVGSFLFFSSDCPHRGAGYVPVKEEEGEVESHADRSGPCMLKEPRYNRRRRWFAYITYVSEDVAPPQHLHNTETCTGLGCDCKDHW